MIQRFTVIFHPSYFFMILLVATGLAFPVFTAFANPNEPVEATPALRTQMPETATFTATVATATKSSTPTSQPTRTPTLTRTPTPLPASYLETTFQTSALLTGAVVL